MPPSSLPPLFYPCSHPHPPHISLYLQFFLLKLGRMKDRRHLCHPSNKTGSWQPWFINDYSALLSQHLEDLCPRRDEPVTCRDRHHNLEMDGDPEAISSGLHPVQEVPGSTLEEGPLSPCCPCPMCQQCELQSPGPNASTRILKCKYFFKEEIV